MQPEPDRRTLVGSVSAFFCAGAEGAQVSRRSRVRPGKVGARASAFLLACIGLVLALGVAAGAAAPRPTSSFAAAKSYAIGKGSGAITLADLNSDGKPDLASPHSHASTVTVFLNRAGGRFAARATYATGAHPWELEAADLNGDGKPDLLSANATSVSVLLNHGDGTFEARRDYPTGRSAFVAIHDLNSDGKPDFLTVNAANTVSVLLNAGDGTFQPRSDYATRRNPGPVSIADLNGDGAPDLVTASRKDKTVSVLLNRGDGGFAPRRDFSVGSAGFSLELAIADLNGDNGPDIVTANVNVGPKSSDSSSLSLLLNDGSGGFGARRDYKLSGDNDFQDLDGIAIRDLDADGDPDLLAYPGFGVGADVVAVFLNRGDGTFAAKRYDITRGLPANLLDLVDLNGDHRLDLVSDNWYAPAPGGFGVVVRLNRGDGSFGARRFYPTDVVESGRLGDLNGDGRPELVLTRFGVTASIGGGPVTSVFVNRGDGRFAPKVDYPTRGAAGIDVADVSGDGRPDVVTSGPSTASVLLNRPGLCNVQQVTYDFTLAAARQQLARGGCRLGRVRYVHQKYWKGRVISQKPDFGAVRAKGARVRLVVNFGPRR